jgi:hypothetical protein
LARAVRRTLTVVVLVACAAGSGAAGAAFHALSRSRFVLRHASL